MSTSTTHYELIMPSLTDSPPDITVTNTNWEKIDDKLKAHDDNIIESANLISNLNQKISSGIMQSSAIGLGMNSVIRKTDGVEAIPKFTMQGKSYVNLLGKDGNCEDVSKWSNWQSTSALDTSNKVFGASSIKITLSSTTGNIFKILSTVPTFDATKYYLFSAYIKNGNATNIKITKDNTGGGTIIDSVAITDTTKFTRIGIIAQPSSLNAGNYFSPYVIGTSGKYAYVDGIQINEITASDYALGIAYCLDKYPYIDSYACLQNPYIEIRHDNLVRNGNREEGIGWWIPPSGYSLRISNGYFVASNGSTYQDIPINPSTNYAFRVVAKAGTGSARVLANWRDESNSYISDVTDQNTASISDVIFTGNSQSPPNAKYLRVYSNTVGNIGNAYFKEWMLIEGTSAPISYKPCRIERCVIESKFTSDDSFTLENGEVSGLLNWKHRTLFGKDYDWQYTDDFTGFKRITLLNIFGTDKTNWFGIKYDGKILTNSGTNTASDRVTIDTSGNLVVSISDTDTGLAESIAPNADELKALMNGWKAMYNNGTRYIEWVSIVNGTVPSGAMQSAVSATTNTASITVSSGGAQFASGDVVYVVSPSGIWRGGGTVTGTPTGTNIPLTASLSVQSGDIVAKADNGSTNVSLLTWCKNNVAPNYEGYQLHYKLANPEPITDANVHIHGDIPKLDNGDNYLYLDYGMVLGESGNIYTESNVAYVNSTANPCRNRVEKFNALYWNQVNDLAWSIGVAGIPQTPIIGYQFMSTPVANFDTNATYTVDYQILKTMHTSPTAITMQYQQDVQSAIKGLAEYAENKQNHDSALDNLVDMSVYEDISFGFNTALPWIHTNGLLYLDFVIQFKAVKKAIPEVTIPNFLLYCGTGSGSAFDITSKVVGITPNLTKQLCVLRFSISDSTMITNIKTYGAIMTGRFTFDCRRRI